MGCKPAMAASIKHERQKKSSGPLPLCGLRSSLLPSHRIEGTPWLLPPLISIVLADHGGGPLQWLVMPAGPCKVTEGPETAT